MNVQISMLKKEKLRLKISDNQREQNEEIVKIIDVYQEAIYQDYEPYRVLNIAVTPNTFLALKGAISTITIFLITNYILGEEEEDE